MAFAPLNADVRMALVGDLLANSDDLDRVEALARVGRAMHRADARFDSALGVAAHRRGDVATARGHFEAALGKQPTELQAIRHLMAYHVADGHWAEAAFQAKVLGRRWPARWREQEPVLLVMAADPAGRAALTESLMAAPRVRRLVVDSLLRADRALAAADLLATWHRNGADDLAPTIGRVTRRLLNDGMIETALMLDRFTVGIDRAPSQGFVNNAMFAFAPSGSAFDWSARAQQGVSFEWHGTTTAGADVTGSANPTNVRSFVRLRFRDSPLRLDNLSQSLVLRPARHRLEVRARARQLRAPRPVYVAVRCQRAIIAELALDPLTDDWQAFAEPFDVPDDCPLQTVSVSNGFMPLSWSSRYQGAIDIGRIQIVGLP